jgi:hypothetical protein
MNLSRLLYSVDAYDSRPGLAYLQISFSKLHLKQSNNIYRYYNLNISDKDLTDLTYSSLSSHIREKLEGHIFSNVSQVLQRALNYESRAKESRSFTRSSDKPRNECPINMIEYANESSDDEEADMCVAEWSWASKSKPFICSILKSASKSR